MDRARAVKDQQPSLPDSTEVGALRKEKCKQPQNNMVNHCGDRTLPTNIDRARWMSYSASFIVNSCICYYRQCVTTLYL